MVPLAYSTVAGIPLPDLISMGGRRKLDRSFSARVTAAQIVALLKTRSAYAPIIH